METHTCTALAGLNRAFYARFADDFARTRRSWPPGFDLILPHLSPGANVLDLGCGNGRFLSFLAARGWHGSYQGVDSSQYLLNLAQQAAGRFPEIASRFVLLDLLTPDWAADLRVRQPDPIVALAVLHHIPGRDNRARFVADCAALLPSGGRLLVSTWQFMSTARLRARIVPWDAIGLRAEDVEPGDYLLSWGKGAAGLRYCAFIERDSLRDLAVQAGLAPVETFYADGREGNLNLYGVFQKREA